MGEIQRNKDHWSTGDMKVERGGLFEGKKQKEMDRGRGGGRGRGDKPGAKHKDIYG